jgi:hypothetical protein
MSRIKLTREDSFKTREIRGTSKPSTKKQNVQHLCIHLHFLSNLFHQCTRCWSLTWPHPIITINKKLVEHEECHVSQALTHLLLMSYNFPKQTRTHINLHTFRQYVSPKLGRSIILLDCWMPLCLV